MKPVPAITADHHAYWGAMFPQRLEVVIGGPEAGEIDCIPVPAIITVGMRDNGVIERVIRVPFALTDEDRAAMLAGGTVWLSCWSMLPIHMLEVMAPPVTVEQSCSVHDA